MSQSVYHFDSVPSEQDAYLELHPKPEAGCMDAPNGRSVS